MHCPRSTLRKHSPFLTNDIVKRSIHKPIIALFLCGTLLAALGLAAFYADKLDNADTSRPPLTDSVNAKTLQPLAVPESEKADSFPRASVRNPISKAFEPVLVEPPTGAISAAIDELKPLAMQGNSSAAYKLYLAIQRCVDVLSNRELLSRTESRSDMPGAIKAVADATERTLRDCEDVGVDEIRSRVQWLEMAAEEGDPNAQVLYSTAAAETLGDKENLLRDPERIRDYREKSMRFLNSAAAQCNLSAFRQLAGIYHFGTIVSRSDQLAYAYEYAQMKLSTIKNRTALNVYASTLTQEQIHQAEVLAHQIVEKDCGS